MIDDDGLLGVVVVLRSVFCHIIQLLHRQGARKENSCQVSDRIS